MKVLIDRLRRNASDCEDDAKWATPELAPLLREAAEKLELCHTALRLARSDMRKAIAHVDEELSALSGEQP